VKKIKPKKKRVSKYPWYYKYLFAAARKTFRWSPAKRNAVKRAFGKCELCEQYADKLVVDHIRPVVDPETGFTTWDSYYTRLFVPESEVQAICSPCHKLKTKTEAKIRAGVRNA